MSDVKVMSHADRRRAKKPDVVLTAEQKQEVRAKLVELRKIQRMMKSNGSRGKIRKYLAKRERDDEADEDALVEVKQNKMHRTEGQSLAPAAPPAKASVMPSPAQLKVAQKSTKTEAQLRKERATRLAGAANPARW